MNDSLITISETCSILDISNSSLQKIRSNPELLFPRPKKLANRSVILFSKNEILQWMEDRINENY